jgi:1-deoxy-D-xylulose-5-phosphate synthase
MRRLGLPDRFVEHGERGELLADLGLDPAGIVQAALDLSERVGRGRFKRQ